MRRESYFSAFSFTLNEFGNYGFSTDGLILYCKMHETKVGCECRFTVKQHLKTFFVHILVIIFS